MYELFDHVDGVSRIDRKKECPLVFIYLLQLKKGGVGKAKGEGEKEKECTTECRTCILLARFSNKHHVQS